MVHKGSLAHPRVFLAYEEYGEESARPTDCHVVREHRKERESSGNIPPGCRCFGEWTLGQVGSYPVVSVTRKISEGN